MSSASEHAEQPENDSPIQIESEDHDAEQPSPANGCDQEPSEQLTGYELVADMLRRQDEVIAEIDALNLRIESAIKEISDSRKQEEQADIGVAAELDLENVPSTAVDQAVPVGKAA